MTMWPDVKAQDYNGRPEPTFSFISRGPVPTETSQGGHHHLPHTYLKDMSGREMTISIEDLWKQGPTHF